MSNEYYLELQKDIDKIIRLLIRDMLLYLDDLNSKDIQQSKDLAMIINKISTSLVRLLKVRGIKLESEDSLVELLSRFNEDDNNTRA